MDERAHLDTATDTTHGGAGDDRPPRAPEAENVLALIFDEPAAARVQGEPTDGHSRDDESFDAFMVSFRDGAPGGGPTSPSAPDRATLPRGPATPTRDPA